MRMSGPGIIDNIQAIWELVALLVALASTWILGVRMRRRIRRKLGRKAEDIDLTSLRTWMAVEEAEEKNARANPDSRQQ